MPLIERIVASDSKTRFNLVSEPDATSGEPVWWIRANQGHSIKEVKDLETTPVLSAADIPTGIAVHGTSLKAWELIRTHLPQLRSESSLKSCPSCRKGRPVEDEAQPRSFGPRHPRHRRHQWYVASVLASVCSQESHCPPFTGMRNAASVHIYIDVDQAIATGIKFELSANGVVLTQGNDQGFVPPTLFSKVVTSKGKVLLETPAAPTEAAIEEVQQKTEALVL